MFVSNAISQVYQKVKYICNIILISILYNIYYLVSEESLLDYCEFSQDNYIYPFNIHSCTTVTKIIRRQSKVKFNSKVIHLSD